MVQMQTIISKQNHLMCIGMEEKLLDTLDKHHMLTNQSLKMDML